MGVYFTIQITNRDEMTLILTQKAWLLWLEHQLTNLCRFVAADVLTCLTRLHRLNMQRSVNTPRCVKNKLNGTNVILQNIRKLYIFASK